MNILQHTRRFYSILFFAFVISFFNWKTVKAQDKDSLTKAILTPKPAATPRINGPKVFGVRPSHPIVFTVPVSGDRPMTFSAKSLPNGVKLDSETGKLSGSIATAGTYIIALEAKNKLGKANRDFKIIVGEEIALTPPMGWNSWNIYGNKVT
ncbi:putative Ig domain-containing protein [Pedobacter sp. UC225_61]|uniref:putative Ig domain-containing protein n=1 Tax=Pedobacter sp. UC225_61 TaxID=3374623 RepID=UPI0037B8018D